MTICNEISPYLHLGATSDKSRKNKALDPNTVPIMDLGIEEWVEFTQQFAQSIHYYRTDTDIPTGNWEQFYSSLSDITDKANYEQGDIPPHQCLFIAFLKLLEFSKDSLNQLSQRHLEFYYKEVLGTKPLDYKPDQVFVKFELAKNTDSYKIPQDKLLDAAKSENGVPRRYRLLDELVANKAHFVEGYTLYSDPTGVYLSSIDELEDMTPAWPFGEPAEEYQTTYGYSFACSDLLFSSGFGEIRFEMQVKKNFSPARTSAEIMDGMIFKISTDTGWETLIPLSIENHNNKLIIIFGASDYTIIPLQEDIHGRSLRFPVLKFEFFGTAGREIYLDWSSHEIKSLKITTKKTYEEGFELMSDQGVLDTTQDFYPFGSIPKRDSWFKVHSDEWYGKNINLLRIGINWKNRPLNLAEHYRAYRSDSITRPFRNVTCTREHKKNTSQTKYEENLEDVHIYWALTPSKSIVQYPTGCNIFGVYTQTPENSIAMFSNDQNTKYELQTSFSSIKPYNAHSIKHSPFKVLLTNDMLHTDYPKLVTIAVTKDKEIPELPYAPISDDIEVYCETSSTTSDIIAYQELPLGYRCESYTSVLHIPELDDQKGYLMLAADDIQVLDNIQFLISLDEGTENPDRIEAEGLSEIRWKYLKDDQWIDFQKEHILFDQTLGFLQDGLVKLQCSDIDRDAMTMPSGKYWICAEMRGSYDKVSRIRGIHTQVGVAVFQNQENSLEHLQNGLAPLTISKMTDRDSQVKKVIQPYSSFGGKPREDQARYYRRISERLRHKNRTVSTWDYNHWILQNYPEVYKTKTLNHTDNHSFVSPGNTLIIVVPNTITRNVFDILQPKLNQSTLQKIQSAVNTRNSLHVEAQVLNPTYSEVQIDTLVKFHKGRDLNHYTQKIKQDITNYIAPWTTDMEAEISFGSTLYTAQIIAFIESLDYVDYIKEFKIRQDNVIVKSVKIEDPRKIITSVKPTEHNILPIITEECNI